MSQQHPWSRYVAIGDSFTEGIGDPEPKSPGGYRGWADRVAEVLGGRQRRLRLREPRDPRAAAAADPRRADRAGAGAAGPTSSRSPRAATTSSAPNTDPDDVAARLEAGVERLRSDGATVVLFNGPDIGMTPVLGRMRGKVAIYNENLRAIAAAPRCWSSPTCGRCASSRTLACGRPIGCTSPPSDTTPSPGWCSTRSMSRTSSSRTRPSRCRRVPGARRGSRTSAGRASTSCPG